MVSQHDSESVPSFDPLVANPGRLQILTALAREKRQEFTSLRRMTRLTDGNLASHARRLQAGGLIQVEKEFCNGKPVTRFVLTSAGQSALQSHLDRLMSAVSLQSVPTMRMPESKAVPVPSPEEEWVD